MAEVFQLDEGQQAGPSPQPRSSPGSSTPTSEPQNAEIALERRVVGLIECSDDICSICLDEYTSEDPGAPTVCGHHFHLQCIMQWAQRSRECPLCFKSLQLEDEDMNSLLPFGEYVSPQQQAAEAASLETWELERLLIRLATASQREHRHHRSSRHSGSSSRHRRQGSRGEASAPQPIQVQVQGSGASGSGGRWSLPGEGHQAPSSSGASAAGAGMPGTSGMRGGDSAASLPEPAACPSSWPPAAATMAMATAGGSSASSMHDSGHMVSPSPRGRSGSFSLKSRLASLKLKDKFDKTAKELKSLFSPGAGGSEDARGGSSSASHH